MSYLPPAAEQFNYLRHLILLYGNAARPWTEEELLYYVVHLDRHGNPDDWFFDSFLFLNVAAASGNDYCADINVGTTMAGEGDFFARCSPRPANKADWDALLEFYLGRDGALVMLERTIERCARCVKQPRGPKRNVVVMLPYPHITQRSFGSIADGWLSLDFSTQRQKLSAATEQRLAAEMWMVDEIVRRFEDHRFEHLHLLGVYWMFETVYRSWEVDDHWLLKELRRHIHARGLKFVWIPFWSTYNVHLLDNYQDYYFDLAFLQPNYMFYKTGKSLEHAARAARERGAGIEMEYYLELPEPIAIQDERQARFREYLNAGVTYGYMTQSACAHFQGVGSLARMYRHEDPIEREFYEDIYHFVKGDYRLKPNLKPKFDSVKSEELRR